MGAALTLHCCFALPALLAVASSQGRHKQALKAARQACKASTRLLHACGSPELSGTVAVGRAVNGGRTRNRWAAVAEMLAVALHAAAVQHEYLGQWAEALAAYHAALATAARANDLGVAAGETSRQADRRELAAFASDCLLVQQFAS